MSRYREVLETDTPASPARLAWATIARLASPAYSVCGRCGAPWNVVEAHTTTIPGTHHGMFPLCEHCWAPLTPKQRLPYYKELLRLWRTEDPPMEHEPGLEELVGAAVMAGG